MARRSTYLPLKEYFCIGDPSGVDVPNGIWIKPVLSLKGPRRNTPGNRPHGDVVKPAEQQKWSLNAFL